MLISGMKFRQGSVVVYLLQLLNILSFTRIKQDDLLKKDAASILLALIKCNSH